MPGTSSRRVLWGGAGPGPTALWTGAGVCLRSQEAMWGETRLQLLVRGWDGGDEGVCDPPPQRSPASGGICDKPVYTRV